MNACVDLLPRSCREALGRRNLIRRWILAYAATGVVLSAAYVLLGTGSRVLSTLRDQLASQVKENLARSEVVSNLLAEIASVESAITRYNRLAWPIRTTDVINTITTTMPVEATLTELSITPREDRQPAGAGARGRRGESGGKQGARNEPPRMLMIVELEGVAVSDAVVARFVSGLDASSLFSRVSLDFTRVRPADATIATDCRGFRITCEVDLTAQFTVVEAGDASASAADDTRHKESQP